MGQNRLWRGVRMRRVAAGADPDAPPRRVTLPAAWDDGAASGLAALADGEGAATLEAAAEGWIGPVADRAAAASLAFPLGDALRVLLLRRRAAPADALWRPASPSAPEAPRFVLNLAAFHEPGLGFDPAALAEAVQTAALALGFGRGAAPSLGFADLDGLIAAAGLAYGSPEARDLGRGVLSLLRDGLDAVAARYPTLPRPALVIGPAGAAEALLGVETAGFAPAFSPLDAAGGLSRATRAFLAARALSPDAALAGLLAGRPVLPVATAADHAAMHDALAPMLDGAPARPMADDEPRRLAAAARRELPARRAGYTQRASVGGHTVFVRTGDYADGTLGELALAAPKESLAFRGLLDSFAAAVSVGLQHGVPLGAFVEALTNARFGPAGVVEGDGSVERASSVVDWAFRHLAASYLGREVPSAPPEEATAEAEPSGASPLLPLDLPPDNTPRARRRALRLVAR